MPLIGASPLAIPPGGDASKAWQEIFNPPPPAPGQDFQRKIPGETFEQFLFGRFLFVSSAAAGNRLIQFTIVDANNGFVGQFPALNTQGPGIAGGYNIVTGAGIPYATAFNVQIIPIPPILLTPGMVISVDIAGVAAGDAITLCSFAMLRIPTGTPAPESAVLLATPSPV